jgi:hypothetical protein
MGLRGRFSALGLATRRGGFWMYTNGTFSPVPGPLRRNGGMKILFSDEAKFIKEAKESEARFKKQAGTERQPNQ